MSATTATRSRPAVEPALRERRNSVARQAGRRRLYLLIGVVVVLGLVAGSLALIHSSLFSVRNVVITGASHESRAEVLSVTGLSASPPLVDVSGERDASALESLPWVKSATVHKHFPSSVSIAVTERVAVGFVETSPGHYAVVDPSGRVLELATKPPSGLVELAGVTSLPSPGQSLGGAGPTLATVAGSVPVSLVSKIGTIGEEAHAGVVIRLSAGPLVELEGLDDLRQKMVSLATLLSPTSRVNLAGIVTINLAVPSSPVLTG